MQRKETQLAASHGHSLLELLSVFKETFLSRVKHGDKSHSFQLVRNLHLTYFLVSVIVHTTKKLLQGITLVIEHGASSVLHLFM